MAPRSSPALWGGRPTVTRTAPASRAAAAFSENPPARPVSLVTRYRAETDRSMAAFISREKGPCMAMMWLGDSPASRQARRESSMGRTRA